MISNETQMLLAHLPLFAAMGYAGWRFFVALQANIKYRKTFKGGDCNKMNTRYLHNCQHRIIIISVFIFVLMDLIQQFEHLAHHILIPHGDIPTSHTMILLLRTIAYVWCGYFLSYHIIEEEGGRHKY